MRPSRKPKAVPAPANQTGFEVGDFVIRTDRNHKLRQAQVKGVNDDGTIDVIYLDVGSIGRGCNPTRFKRMVSEPMTVERCAHASRSTPFIFEPPPYFAPQPQSRFARRPSHTACADW